MRTGAEMPGNTRTEVAGNARLVHEYMDYLRVEKGMRPATCEAYARDLEQFAEQVERRDALLLTAVDYHRRAASDRSASGVAAR